MEDVEGQEGTSKLIKVMLLGLKAQRSISQGANIEMKQIAVKQLDLLRHVRLVFRIRLIICSRSVMTLDPISICWPRAL